MTKGDDTPAPVGVTELAKLLSTPSRPVSRQQVYMWARRRRANGFPPPVKLARHQVRTFALYDPVAVADWYANYVPSAGGRPSN